MKTDKEIEKMLMSGEKHILSTQEKSTIKSTLMQHATTTLKNEEQTVSSLWSTWMLRSSLSFASLVIIFAVTALASEDSLPGQPLYSMKIRVVEEMIALTKITPETQIAYDIRLMEHRLEEIKEMVIQDINTSPEDLESLTGQIDSHVTDITSTLEEDTSNHIAPKEKIRVLAKLSGVTKAQAKIAQERPEFVEVADSINNTQESTTDAIATTVEDFVQDETVDNVNEYLSDQMISIGEYINASTTNNSSRDLAEYHLHDVDEALIVGNIQEALVSIIRATEDINSQDYLNEELGGDNTIELD